MTEVVVVRCVLRIRRTAGWAWGASADDLIAMATRALPTLIGARLARATADSTADVHVTAPVRIRVAAQLADLVALATPTSGRAELARATLAQAIDAALAPALARIVHAPAALLGEPESPTARDAEPGLAADAEPRLADAVRALRAWWQSGAIAEVLARLAPGALAGLQARVLGEPPSESTPALLAIARSALAEIATAPALAEPIPRRLALAAAILAADPTTLPARLVATIDAIAPAAAHSAAASHADAPAPAAVAAPIDAPGIARATLRELDIPTVLPFLLLPALDRAGWLASAAALADAHASRAATFALAVGLAATVIDRPERGWARTPADRAVIAAFAGRCDPLDDGDVAVAATRIAPILPALDDLLHAAVSRVRSPGPLVLARDDRGWLLIDTDGMVALGRTADLRRVLAGSAADPILVPAALATPAVLDQLDLANRRFVAPGTPARGEPWRRFAGIGGPQFTNDTHTPIARLIALTADLASTFALADELCELLTGRAAIPRAVGASGAEGTVAPLDATCALAATAALADLAARLFPDERTTPALVLSRFRNLDARVRHETDRIVVRVPLGRRHAELMRHGVLGTWRAPWLGDRVVELGGA